MKAVLRPAGLLLAAVTVVLVTSQAWAAPGLLLVAHGSPNAEWNRPVLAFGQRVAEEAQKQGRFKAVRTAMLEFSPPAVAVAVAELEAAGCDRIVAVPLFIAPSGHTHFDVPTALGVYRSPQMLAQAAAEGMSVARPRVPILLTPTAAEGDLLADYVLDQARKLSKSPRNEALVLLAHGDPEHELMIERTMRRIATRCCGETGIAWADWAYVAAGQEYAHQGLPVIRRAAEVRGRAVVVALFVSTSAERMHRRAAAAGDPHAAAGDPLKGLEVAFSSEPLITFPGLLDWVLKTAHAALDP